MEGNQNPVVLAEKPGIYLGTYGLCGSESFQLLKLLLQKIRLRRPKTFLEPIT